MFWNLSPRAVISCLLSILKEVCILEVILKTMCKNCVSTEETAHTESLDVPEILENYFFAQSITIISMILKTINDGHFLPFYIMNTCLSWLT